MSIPRQENKGSNPLKVLVSLALMLSICLTLVFGWLNPVSTPSSVTVTVLMSAIAAQQWKPLIEIFHQRHRDITLNIIEGPNATNQLEDLYTSSFILGNSPYDLVWMDVIWVPKFAAAGWLRELSDFISSEELGEFVAGDINGSRYQGKLYRIPLYSGIGMLYYRTDLLKKAGYEPPETFKELMKIAQTLQQQNLVDWGYVWQGKQYEGLSAMFVEILQGHGGYWVNTNTLEVGLDHPEAIAAVKFLRSTLEQKISPPGTTTYGEEEVRRLFQNGNAAFMRNLPYAVSLASASDSPIRGQFSIQPMVHAPEYLSGACLGGWGIGITKSSQNPEAAWKVIEFFSSEEVQREFILQTAYVPTRYSLFNDPKIVAKYAYYPQLLKVVKRSTLRPPIAQYAQASDILQRYLSAALTQRMTPKEAMKRAAQETRRLLSVAGEQSPAKIFEELLIETNNYFNY